MAASKPLVVLRSEGARAPLFCLHPTGGHVNEYVCLRDLLGADQPLYAIESRACRGGAAEHTSIESMAAEYATLVQQARRAERYKLFGWSMGGVTAHAVACELERRGAQVELVGMADPRLEDANHAAAAAHEMVAVALEMAIQIFNPQPPAPATIRRHVRALDRERLADVESLFAWCEELGLLPLGAVRREELVATVRLVPEHRALVAAHVPGVCRANIALWRADTRFALRSHDWAKHTSGELRESSVGGTHFTVMRPPHVERIAADLLELASP